ncbi:MAG: hypothetical protein KJ887_02820 [Candidatus Omnitrophica bacterium]|nr:hypothetical protein [Candidatus Omnitrophota bacterium]MBU1047649.1 hypothetical protein [Candidatus Omnitrophota bacterium]MBU1631114.1 hypothetical protein [Candidatus Omnitrophota bacterium]MBU1767504.1 hypothetical protein [Candidatus Omnitrophota bacterium]MBU1888621.1 hypothetical protein [Candidatus Omnitrophota bacterium]
MTKQLKSFLNITVILLILISMVLLVLIRVFDIEIVFSPGLTKNKSLYELKWNSKLNRIQEGNTCGAHSVMAVLYLEKNEIKDPYKIYEAINEKLGNGYIYPWGLTRYLKNKSIKAKNYYLGLLSNKQKEQWIKNKIINEIPIIIIIGNSKYLHYITVMGFNTNEYFVYDSLVKSDMNGDLPGNITVPALELLNKWNNAVFKGIHLNLSISQ